MGNARGDGAGRLKAGEILKEMALTLWYLRAVLMGLVLLFVLLTFGMYHWGAPVETANRTPSSMAETVYFCAITALTIGYGDVVPTSTFGRIDAVCLGLIGFVFTGLF